MLAVLTEVGWLSFFLKNRLTKFFLKVHRNFQGMNFIFPYSDTLQEYQWGIWTSSLTQCWPVLPFQENIRSYVDTKFLFGRFSQCRFELGFSNLWTMQSSSGTNFQIQKPLGPVENWVQFHVIIACSARLKIV